MPNDLLGLMGFLGGFCVCVCVRPGAGAPAAAVDDAAVWLASSPRPPAPRPPVAAQGDVGVDGVAPRPRPPAHQARVAQARQTHLVLQVRFTFFSRFRFTFFFSSKSSPIFFDSFLYFSFPLMIRVLFFIVLTLVLVQFKFFDGTRFDGFTGFYLVLPSLFTIF